MFSTSIHLIDCETSAFSMKKQCFIYLFRTVQFPFFLSSGSCFSLFMYFPFRFCDTKDTVMSQDCIFCFCKNLFCLLWIVWISM